MKVLVTGSAGHLGEALVRVLQAQRGIEVVGLDIKHSPFTTAVGSITDARFVDDYMRNVEVVYHTATLHKPHIETHSKQAFIDTNISGTLVLLEAATTRGVGRFVLTSTTSVFGDAMRPAAGEPAAWVTEQTQPRPKNIYGVTKLTAEALCHLFHREKGLNCLVLRTARFFPEEDDDRLRRTQFSDANLKANEFLYRRVDIEDVVKAHLRAAERASELGFGRYIISATTPFHPHDMALLNTNAPQVVEQRVPSFVPVYHERGWRMFEQIDRVYVNESARRHLGWTPAYGFSTVLARHQAGLSPVSELAAAVGSKGYHDEVFRDGPYPVSE